MTETEIGTVRIHETGPETVPTPQVETVTVSITVSVNGESKQFSATGETDGNGFVLAQRIGGALQRDTWDWCDAQDSRRLRRGVRS